MEESYGFLSLLPPVIAIVLAITTRQVFISLLFGIWLGWMIISGFQPVVGTLATVQGLVDVFQDPGNTRTIMFAALVGALIIFIQRSGGVEGFIRRVTRFLDHYEARRSGSNRKSSRKQRARQARPTINFSQRRVRRSKRARI